MEYLRFNSKEEAEKVRNQHAKDVLPLLPNYVTTHLFNIKEDTQGRFYYPSVQGVELAMGKVPIHAQEKIQESSINWKE